MGALGTARAMTLTIAEGDDLLEVKVTYSSGNEVQMMHEHFYGLHPADIDTRLGSLSHAPRFN